MNRERLYLFDTTLRDGALTTGVDFSLEDKRQIAGLLDELGVDYVEGGYPGANPQDTRFFERKPTRRARFCAFGMTKRPGRSAANDPGIAALLAADADAIVFVAKAWDYHVHVALGCTLEENLACIEDSVRAAVAAGREAMVDCEHFFDGWKANPAYAMAMRAHGARGGRAVGRALRHQWRHAAGRGGAHRRRSRARHPRRAAGHSRAQRHRQRGRQFAGRGSRGRAADPGNAERPRRALRQRQSRFADSDPGAEGRLRGSIRDRRFRRGLARHRQSLAHARRAPQPRARPSRALCRRLGVRDQGGHSRLRARQGPAHLRARRRRRRLETRAQFWSPIRRDAPI